MHRIVTAMFVLCLTAGTARAESVGYVDTNRVYQQATEPQRVIGALNAEQAQVDRARASKDKSADDQARAHQEHQQAAAASLQQHLAPVLLKLKADRHLSEILPIVPLTPSKSDLTDEVIRRWDAADAQGMAEELARTKAELAAAKAKPEPPKK